MDCAYQCYEIGGPWIAENPYCPVHGQGKRSDSDAVQSAVGDLDEGLLAQFCHRAGGRLSEVLEESLRDWLKKGEDA